MRLINAIAGIILSIGISICWVWVLVSFLLYLVKDIPFNWAVFWIGIICIPLLAFSAIVMGYYKAKDSKITIAKNPRYKSRFEVRMEEIKAKKARIE